MAGQESKEEALVEAQRLIVTALRFCDQHGLADVARPLDAARNAAAELLRAAGRNDLIEPVPPPAL